MPPKEVLSFLTETLQQGILGESAICYCIRRVL